MSPILAIRSQQVSPAEAHEAQRRKVFADAACAFVRSDTALKTEYLYPWAKAALDAFDKEFPKP